MAFTVTFRALILKDMLSRNLKLLKCLIIIYFLIHSFVLSIISSFIHPPSITGHQKLCDVIIFIRSRPLGINSY